MKKFEIHGMTCGHCTASVSDALGKVPGLTDITVNLDDKIATFDTDESVTDDQIKQAVAAIGFEVGALTDA